MDIVFLTSDQQVVTLKHEQDIVELLEIIRFEHEGSGRAGKGRVKLDGIIYDIKSLELNIFSEENVDNIKDSTISKLYKENVIGDSVAVFNLLTSTN